MKRYQLISAGLFGFLAVAFGAFGAHALKNSLNEQMLDVYKTGVMYHLIHSAVILAIALTNKLFKWPFIFLSVGIILFSFSLYLYTITGQTFFAIITPFGGMSFLIGWVFIVWEGIKMKNANS